MDNKYSCNLFNNNDSGQNGNFTPSAWDIWDHHHLSSTTINSTQTTFHHHAAKASTSGESDFREVLTPYAGIGTHYHPDPHLMCLKLGKRNYFEDASGSAVAVLKRGKAFYGGEGEMVVPSAVTVAVPATVPRCQVEGCHVALLNAKDYHRRHKVCEVHSKAPRVVVLGLQQRFCQQCSRFHVVTEFDDSKRSCRRRLAGHNERRRKGSHDHSLSRNNPSQGRFTYSSSPTGRALSLLSSTNESFISSPELSSRCSAALRELIAENRAALFSRQLVVDKVWPLHHQDHDVLNNGHQNDHATHFGTNQQHHVFPEPHGWDDRLNGTGTSNVTTLELMQAPTSAFELLSMRGKSKDDDDQCADQLWSSFDGTTHVI